jgi:plasmid stabilization system protein ParE
MKYSLAIQPEAEEDLRQAFLWYEEQREGLGEEFLHSIEAGMKRIGDHPLMFSKIHKDVRRHLIRRFPYGIFYTVEMERIAILAVFHVARDPQQWMRRRVD